MKKSMYVLMMLSFMLFSCGGSTEKTAEATDDETVTEQKNENTGGEASKDCDEYLDNYEKWVDDYLEVLEVWKEDPTNVANTQKMATLAETYGTWMQEWTQYASCAAQEKYEKRFEEIGDKVDKKLEELGLE